MILTYNELGQLLNKQLHGTGTNSFLYTNSFRYNERGWLKKDESTEFSMELNYDDSEKPQYNGNISGQKWGARSNFPNVFNYEYDGLNRLVKGNTTAGIPMSEVLSYDENGNIKTLSRQNGLAGTYEYPIGNRLNRIIGGPLATGVYQYDGNGNVTYDGRNGFSLTYNTLGLPKTAIGGTHNLAYTYDATGTKLRRVKNGSSRDYIDGIEYNGSVIDIIHTETGIARNNSGTYTYEYNLTDHLGNVRYTFNKHPVTGLLQPLQADNYFAFGLRKPLIDGGVNQYLYNGKELQEELGQLDYGARFYDPVVGRWSAIDPLAEQYRRWSPYNYVMNNPIRFIDPDGMEVILGVGSATYTGEHAGPAFSAYMQGRGTSSSDEEDDEKKDPEKKKDKQKPVTEEERQAALEAWYENMLALNELMNDFMSFKMFAETFTSLSPARVKEFKKPEGTLEVEKGGDFSESELYGGNFLKRLGYNVKIRIPTGTRAGGKTSDYLVNGKNYDMYTPTTSSIDRIISNVAKKNTQATGIVIDLSKTPVTPFQLGNIYIEFVLLEQQT